MSLSFIIGHQHTRTQQQTDERTDRHAMTANTTLAIIRGKSIVAPY